MNKSFESLRQLVEINSKTSNIAGVNSFGQEIVRLYSDLDIDWEFVKKEGCADFLIGRTAVKDNSPVVCLSAHMDVVFEPEQVRFDEKEDKIFGSGVSDMKSSFIVNYEILKELKKENKLFNIILSFSPEEEVGTPNYRDTIKSIAEESNYVLVFESTLNTGGNEDLNTRSIVKSRRGFQHFDVSIEGPGGHSGLIINKSERLNTILVAAELIQKLEKLADYKKITTLNIGTIKGGQAVNVIAPTTEFSFEFRFKTNDEYKRIYSEVQQIFESKNFPKEISVKLNENKFYPNLESNSGDFIEICKEVAESQSVNLVIEERNGGSEASLFKFFNAKAQVLDGFGVRGGGEHSENEYIFKESLESTIKYGKEVLYKIL